MRTLLIDNHDSFTYNLFQLLAEVGGKEPIVVRSDEAGWDRLSRLRFDNVVLSPGPGDPGRVRDFGVCAEAIARCEAPLLGICLGHQGLARVHGGRVGPAPEAVHGRLSTVRHDGSALFAGIPREFRAVRYHSLCVEVPLPEELDPIAWASDGTLMALRHRKRRQWGVQFHPESICAEHGRRLIQNFCDLTAASRRPFGARRDTAARLRPAAVSAAPAVGELGLQIERLDCLIDAERAFVHLHGEDGVAFWLDSSRSDDGARFSFLGAADGPLAATILYDVEAGEVSVERAGAVTETIEESIFEYLDRESERLRLSSNGLPFDFDCGFVGYLGYELKAECGGERAHRAETPDAAFVFADRLIAFDHRERRTYLLCLVEPGREREARRWLEETRRRLLELPPLPPPEMERAREPTAFRLRRDRGDYLADVEDCKRRLREGESYEICLTNQMIAEAEPDPLALYRRLRRLNPAPFSAFLRFGETVVLSSSPERFLRIDRSRQVEARPIKGTRRRGRSPAEDARLAAELVSSEKDRAENLMVTDMLRHDLGGVCEVGSVEVPRLMELESYETVHQLVSTIRGTLRAGIGTVGCVRACFPGGSMTGAPKKRTMEIIDELEGEARGVYSGALGYFGLGGACDLSIVIRTVVLRPGSARIGIGGGVVTESDPHAEYQESVLKGRAPMQSVDARAELVAESALDLSSP